MKKYLGIVVFAVIVIALIGFGVWYNDQAEQQAAQTAMQAGQAAQQAQQQLMQELNIKDSVVGTGTVAEAGDTVSVLYTGTLDNGKVFDASSLHGNQPFSFTIGAQQVIQGWDLGVAGMKVGGTRELTIPPDLGYGSQAVGGIPANSTLHFTIQLLSVGSSTQQ
ncbi:MAG TPA: FKBP-type peptidyl-prolyl cis-trans isomerase [Candidatus Paceibacterota bacterium]|nr:FKBP-type peptidyl-prolyl cis-trans isomerase [Candidatus Paceibacterota bacterium]